MKIISWNVNSVRARIENIKNYIKDSTPDVLLLQEIKTQNENFPNDEFKNLGYTSYVFGQKSYNGVAIISKHKLDNTNNNFIKDDLNQSRIITAELKLKKKKIELINIYVPNGNPVDTEKYEYKKSWLKKFITNVKKKIQNNSNILIAGDFNIIPEEIDVHDFKRYENDALGRLEIRKKFRELINLGFKDVYRFKNKTKQEYTFWDYFAGSWQKNYGMRIDHFLLSNGLIENIKSININRKPRSREKPSDHTPIELEII
jgi:exodeoxyribonuclease-3